MYDLRRVLATIVAVEKQWVVHNLCVCVCSLRYPSCNAPYRNLWHSPLYNIFPRCLKNKICVSSFSTTFIWKMFILRRNERYSVWLKIYVYLHVKYPFSPFRFWWLLNLLDRFRKVLRYQIWWKSVQWEPSCCMRAHGRTDRHGDANSHFSQICERA